MTAGDLLTACTTAAPHWVEFCNGFFQAAHDAGAIAGDVCAPPGTTRIDLVEAYERIAPGILAAQPDVTDMSGFRLAVAILAETFPCNGRR